MGSVSSFWRIITRKKQKVTNGYKVIIHAFCPFVKGFRLFRQFFIAKRGTATRYCGNTNVTNPLRWAQREGKKRRKNRKRESPRFYRGLLMKFSFGPL
jgi:hypothetical protein